MDHFYVKQFLEEDFTAIEKTILLSKDWGGEVGILGMGVFKPFKVKNCEIRNDLVGAAAQDCTATHHSLPLASKVY